MIKLQYWGMQLASVLTLPTEFKLSRSKIMYIENKSEGLEGDARIGRVYYSKTFKTLYYRGLRFQSLKGSGFKANFYELDSQQGYWISGPRKDQHDRLYGGHLNMEVDADVLEEYADLIGGVPAQKTA